MSICDANMARGCSRMAGGNKCATKASAVWNGVSAPHCSQMIVVRSSEHTALHGMRCTCILFVVASSSSAGNNSPRRQTPAVATTCCHSGALSGGTGTKMRTGCCTVWMPSPRSESSAIGSTVTRTTLDVAGKYKVCCCRPHSVVHVMFATATSLVQSRSSDLSIVSDVGVCETTSVIFLGAVKWPRRSRMRGCNSRASTWNTSSARFVDTWSMRPRIHRIRMHAPRATSSANPVRGRAIVSIQCAGTKPAPPPSKTSLS